MKKMCIFDLDGTLLNTLPTISYYVNMALSEYELGSIEENRFKTLVGNGARVLIERVLDEVGADRDEYFDKVYKLYNKEYDKNVSYLTKPYDGIPELLASLKTEGYTIAVLSNKPDFAAKNACKLFFGDLIDIAHGGIDGIELKPSPEGVFNIFDESGFSAEDSLYIGDTGTDMQTGKAAGIYTIGVLWGFRERAELEANGADVIISKPDEILKISVNA